MGVHISITDLGRFPVAQTPSLPLMSLWSTHDGPNREPSLPLMSLFIVHTRWAQVHRECGPTAYVGLLETRLLLGFDDSVPRPPARSMTARSATARNAAHLRWFLKIGRALKMDGFLLVSLHSAKMLRKYMAQLPHAGLVIRLIAYMKGVVRSILRRRSSQIHRVRRAPSIVKVPYLGIPYPDLNANM